MAAKALHLAKVKVLALAKVTDKSTDAEFDSVKEKWVQLLQAGGKVKTGYVGFVDFIGIEFIELKKICDLFDVVLHSPYATVNPDFASVDVVEVSLGHMKTLLAPDVPATFRASSERRGLLTLEEWVLKLSEQESRVHTRRQLREQYDYYQGKVKRLQQTIDEKKDKANPKDLEQLASNKAKLTEAEEVYSKCNILLKEDLQRVWDERAPLLSEVFSEFELNVRELLQRVCEAVSNAAVG